MAKWNDGMRSKVATVVDSIVLDQRHLHSTTLFTDRILPLVERLEELFLNCDTCDSLGHGCAFCALNQDALNKFYKGVK